MSLVTSTTTSDPVAVDVRRLKHSKPQRRTFQYESRYLDYYYFFANRSSVLRSLPLFARMR
jgi:hypothetical protein